MTVDDFVRAAGLLRRRNVSLRTFVLISPPGVPDEEQDPWLCKSVDTAFASGAIVVSLVPTRGGNGALEVLAASGAFREPRLGDIERSVEAVYSRGPRVFVDLWDLKRFSDCTTCFEERRSRLHTMNLEQRVLPSVTCTHCAKRADC
jgi:uncharacterized Fe-S cluster-containing MiaB family protein